MTPTDRLNLIKVISRIVVSVVLLIIGIYLILKGRNSALINFGCGLLGMVAGYWLK